MAEPLVVVEGVSRRFDVSKPWLERTLEGVGRQELRAVSEASLTIAAGQTFGLVGESGSGKSTLARLIVGLDRPTEGRIRFDGVDVGGRGWGERRRRVQMIFQDPYASLNPRWRVEAIVAEPIRTFGLAAGVAVRARVGELLALVGLDPRDMEKYPHEFSGGQRQRIAIARALASEPDFIVCDEPTSALDVSVQAQVLNLMRDLQRRFNLTYLLISHDLAVVRHMSDEIGVMYLGRLVEVAPKRDIFAAPRHPYTQMLLGAVPDLAQLDETVADDAPPAAVDAPVRGEIPSPIAPPPGCTFHPRCPIAFARCRVDVPEPLLSGGTRVACHAVEEADRVSAA